MSKYYELLFDMDFMDANIENGNPCIYAEACNIDDIETQTVKKGFFDNIVFQKDDDFAWPEINFYYSSLAGKQESGYLDNIKRWPIFHNDVVKRLQENGISGITFHPINLIDVNSNNINNNYSVLFIKNIIDAFDMNKSAYKYNEKYEAYTFLPMKTYLNMGNCEGYDIFRADKSVARIYVSKKVKDIIQKSNSTGFMFLEQK